MYVYVREIQGFLGRQPFFFFKEDGPARWKFQRPIRIHFSGGGLALFSFFCFWNERGVCGFGRRCIIESAEG